jgi:hypothetical protein
MGKAHKFAAIGHGKGIFAAQSHSVITGHAHSPVTFQFENPALGIGYDGSNEIAGFFGGKNPWPDNSGIRFFH